MKATFTFDSCCLLYNNGMDTTGAHIAHVLRRLQFGVTGSDVNQARDRDLDELIDEYINADGWSLPEDETNSRNFDDVEYDEMPKEWLNRMLVPEGPLHERMVWFWHNHFTTSRQKTNEREMWRQHQRVRRHALGNVRTLAREMLTDGAMLHFLDGAGSRGESPNENLSREFMELFMVGRNAGYTEDDVRAGARILAGWWVDYETGEIGFDDEAAYNRPVTFLGQRKRWNLESYIDAITSMPESANHVAAAVHQHFVSTPLSDTRRAELGQVLRANDWEMRPLLAAILHHDDFRTAKGERTLQPVEWLTNAARVYGFNNTEDFDFKLWRLQATGQVPFEPPNVAGWPDDDRWSSATQVMARANAIIEWELSDRLVDRIEPTPVAVLAHCGIYDASPETLAALDRAISAQTEYDRGLDLLLALAVVSPEFATV